MVYDLHTHSYASDGILSPEEVVSSAKLAGVTCLALTDHDTVAGFTRAKAAAQAHELHLISGIEISTTWRARGIHVVGLDVDIEHPELLAFVASQSEAREQRAVMIAERLAKLGIPNALAAAKKHANGGTLGRPHFAKHLIETGRVFSMNAAFKQYLGNGKPGDVKSVWPSVSRAVEVITAAGGLSVLAHPLKYKMTRTKLCELLGDFAGWGGDAVEVISGKQTPQETRDLQRLAERFELSSSCGSDFHAPGQPWQALGTCSHLPEGADPVWTHFTN